MHFAGANWYAIFICAVVGMVIGAAWYGVLGKQWMAADGRAGEMRHGIVPYVVAGRGRYRLRGRCEDGSHFVQAGSSASYVHCCRRPFSTQVAQIVRCGLRSVKWPTSGKN